MNNRCTMPLKKIKGMTEVTRKNEAKVMGEINRFLKKSTVRFNRFAKKQIGFEYAVASPGTEYEVEYTRPVYSDEEYPVYIPYIGGKCTRHWLRDDNDIKYENAPLLSISTKYESSCVPICEGDRYKIYGNKLIISRKPYNLINTICNTTYEFDNVEEYQVDPMAVKVSGVLSDMYDSLLAFEEEINYLNAPYEYDDMTECLKLRLDEEREAIYCANEIYDKISNVVKSSLLTMPDANAIQEEIQVGDTTVKIFVHCKDALDPFSKNPSVDFGIVGSDTRIQSLKQLFEKVIEIKYLY